jgi:hypothetical protein
VPVEHVIHAGAQLKTLIRQFDADGPSVMGRALLDQVAVLHHLANIVRHVRAEIVATVRQFTDRQLFLTDIEQNQRLNIVDVLDPETVKLCFHDLQKLAVEPLDQFDRFKVARPCVFHGVGARGVCINIGHVLTLANPDLRCL